MLKEQPLLVSTVIFLGGERGACENARRQRGESQFPDHVSPIGCPVPFLNGQQENVNAMAFRPDCPAHCPAGQRVQISA